MTPAAPDTTQPGPSSEHMLDGQQKERDRGDPVQTAPVGTADSPEQRPECRVEAMVSAAVEPELEDQA